MSEPKVLFQHPFPVEWRVVKFPNPSAEKDGWEGRVFEVCRGKDAMGADTWVPPPMHAVDGKPGAWITEEMLWSMLNRVLDGTELAKVNDALEATARSLNHRLDLVEGKVKACDAEAERLRTELAIANEDRKDLKKQLISDFKEIERLKKSLEEATRNDAARSGP